MSKHYSKEVDEYVTGVHSCTAFIGLFIIMIILGIIVYIFWIKTIGTIDGPVIKFEDTVNEN